ncbi:uncharacterized protein LOC120217594 [Hibiscus syriacus]|uniref:uncharacterized protein LOC120217594 n=1 Tax=Hibiscus syriacus TaxID=106335 RepID=UPI0019237DC2|nr:uncharacterized protein LOC120217594 [Hibiscus syriacus]
MHNSKSTGDEGLYLLTDEVWIPSQGDKSYWIGKKRKTHSSRVPLSSIAEYGRALGCHASMGGGMGLSSGVCRGLLSCGLQAWIDARWIRASTREPRSTVNRWIVKPDPTVVLLRRWELLVRNPNRFRVSRIGPVTTGLSSHGLVALAWAILVRPVQSLILM